MNDFNKYIVQQRKHHFWLTVETFNTKSYAEAYANLIATEQNPTRIMQFNQYKYESVIIDIVLTLILLILAIIASFTPWHAFAAIIGILFFETLTFTLLAICQRKECGLFW